ncbi:MAG TPA: alkaline phosphatase family protein [Candidatus Dormibacteraeota bacterium]|jgi:phospholipase C|nr:alkaline phosphatase family protein [Candidatus Dormibacteraeota bacterium]
MPLRPTRRDILRAGIALGGGAAVGGLPAGLLDALAAPACGTLADIEHVVILIQENRSFDHYFGTYPGVRGFDDTSVLLPGGHSAFSQPAPSGSGLPARLLPFHIDTAVAVPGPRPGECTNDIEHQWSGQHLSRNHGHWDNWVGSHVGSDGNTAGPLTMGYYTRADIPLYHQLADSFTICDAYFCAITAGTDVNRLYSMTGTIDPDAFDGGLQFLDTKLGTIENPGADLGTAGRWKPYPQLLGEAGITWKVYGTADGQAGDNVLRYFPQFRPSGGNTALAQAAFGSNAFPADFAADCLAGTLPQVSWLVAGLADTEHAPDPLEWGQDVTRTVLTALFNSGLWGKTAVFVTYDENGGFFDHVPPPTPDAGEPGEFLKVSAMSAGALAEADKFGSFAAEPIGLGPRVPLLVISPFSRNSTPAAGPLVCSDVFDHTSLLRFIETRFGVRVPDRNPATRTPGLSAWRRRTVGDLTSAFNFAAPDPGTPTLVLTNRADPRVLAECVITLEPTTLVPQSAALAQPYPLPATQAMPAQEALTGRVRRPSGICAATVTAVPSPVASPSPAPLPNTSRPASGLPFAAEVGMGALLLAGAWAARRRRAGAEEAAAAPRT